jgi:hypothetical protein
MRRKEGMLCFLMVLSFISLPFASYSAQLPLVRPASQDTLNGDYVVFVQTNGMWREAGSISCDKFFREHALNVNGLLPNSGDICVRILQRGGGAAHIDSVLLGSTPPSAVHGVQGDRVLAKLLAKDNDVIDVFQKDLELIFPAAKNDGLLRVCARVEGERISEVPFQFPIPNLLREMTPQSAFYVYKMGENPRNADRALKNAEPLFKELSPTGSGHPTGYTYGWVGNDDRNLYVSIDFTPDNTMDGAKDYAKVYVNTKTGLKEFKVSEPCRTWGAPPFHLYGQGLLPA